MPTQTFLTHLRALKPAHTITQQQTLAWLVEAHTRAEMTLATRNGTHFEEDRFRVRIAHALARFGCSADKIATRGVELADAGTANRNYWYFGWQVQRRLSDLVTQGGEVFHTTADQIDGATNVRFNLGFVIDLTEHHHILCSAGRSIFGDTLFQGYLAYQVTL